MDDYDGMKLGVMEIGTEMRRFLCWDACEEGV